MNSWFMRSLSWATLYGRPAKTQGKSINRVQQHGFSKMAVACMPYAMAMTPDLASIWIDTSTTTWVLDGQQLEKAGKPPTQSFLGSQNQSFTLE